MEVCRLCGGESAFAFRKLVLERHDVSYFRCASCAGVQTQTPTWLDEAYAIPGVHLDVGIASRSLKNAVALATLLEAIGFDRAAPAVDFGSATGLLARQMRDFGYNFLAQDRYSTPLFVNYFLAEPSLAAVRPRLLTAFEVFEHFPEPARDLGELLGLNADLIVFSTWFNDGQPDDWIYYTPECGQHVFLYSQAGFADFAAKRGYEIRFCSFFHLLVRKGGLSGAAAAALDAFCANSESQVAAALGPLFESVKFGNAWIDRDRERAQSRFDEELRFGAHRSNAGAADAPDAPAGPPAGSAAPVQINRSDPVTTSKAFEANPNWAFADETAKLHALGVHNLDTSDFDAIVAARHGRKDEIRSALDLGPGDIVMDLGSGLGFVAEVLAPLVKQVHCCDISPTFLEDCAKRLKGVHNVKTHLIGYADLSSARGLSINKAYSTLLFIHFNFYDIYFYLQEINKVMTMGGRFYFDYNDGENFFVDNKTDSFHEHIAIYKEKRESWIFGCMHMTSTALLRNLMPQLGFKIVDHWPGLTSFSMMLIEKTAEL